MKFKDIKNKEARDSGMAIALACLIIVLIFKKDVFLFPAILFLLVTMIKPIIIKPFAFIWLNLSHYIGALVSKLILSLIFFILVIPTGIIFKLIGKDPMYLKKWKDGKGDSVMVVKNHVYTSKDLNNPF